jgi:hypothetical protein
MFRTGFSESKMSFSRVQRVTVDSVQGMESAISSWLAQGFVIANKTDKLVTMQKKKEFSILWAVVGLLLCILPLLIYLIVYVCQVDVEIVEIVVRS